MLRLLSGSNSGKNPQHLFRYLISTLSQQRECAAIISVREEGRAPDRLQSDARRWKRNNNYVMA